MTEAKQHGRTPLRTVRRHCRVKNTTNMRTEIAIVVGACLAVATQVQVFGAKADGPKARARVYAQFDKNSNGNFESDEREAIRKAYEADKQGELRWFDRDQDGKLSDAELDQIKPPPKDDKQKTDAQKPKDTPDKAVTKAGESKQHTNAPTTPNAAKTVK